MRRVPTLPTLAFMLAAGAGQAAILEIEQTLPDPTDPFFPFFGSFDIDVGNTEIRDSLTLAFDTFDATLGTLLSVDLVFEAGTGVVGSFLADGPDDSAWSVETSISVNADLFDGPGLLDQQTDGDSGVTDLDDPVGASTLADGAVSAVGDLTRFQGPGTVDVTFATTFLFASENGTFDAFADQFGFATLIYTYDDSPVVPPVPLPASGGFLLAGLLALGAARRLR